jgi:hypothetical protein
VVSERKRKGWGREREKTVEDEEEGGEKGWKSKED